MGACLTGAGLIDTGSARPSALPAEDAARVNDRIITRELVDRVTRDVAEKRSVAVDDGLRRSVVAGLVDEELLVQRGIALGLPRVDRRVRSGLTRAAIERIMLAQDETPPSDADLRTFIDGHPEVFAPAAKLRVRQIVFRITGGDTTAALHRAQQAVQRVRAGEDFAAVGAQEGDAELARIPDGLLTRAKLLDYVGPTVVQAAAALPAGAISEPILSGKAYHLVQVQERDASAVPELARVREQALKEYQRRAGDRWLRTRLDQLRRAADITVHD
jgi:peptidyl-prolyl cis-trans isomerase SurA